MKLNFSKNKIWLAAVIAAAYAVAFVLFRYALFDLHGMKQFPLLLAALGVTIGIISGIFGKMKLALTSLAGYAAGFPLALLLQTNGFDPGGGATSNMWLIWALIFAASVLLSIILEICTSKKRPR